jgi:hypothetical protein
VEIDYAPADLPRDAGVMHAWVQDPVRERNDALFVELRDLQERARLAGASVVQPVEVLSNSLRDVQHERLARAGVRTPRVVPVDGDFAESLGGLTPPLVVRRLWGHGSRLRRLDTGDEVARWLTSRKHRRGEWVAVEYVDARGDDGLFRKYRSVFFGERCVRRHLIASRDWEVRPSDRVLTDEIIAEELAFLDGPADERTAFEAVRRELGFDIAAFDFSLGPDGQPIVWEVNPYPDLATPRRRDLEHLAEAIERGHRALYAFYRERLDAVG